MKTFAESIAWHPEHPGFSEDILPFYFAIEALIPKGGLFVEAGVFLGRSLAYMGTIRPDLQLVAIDAWSESSLKPSHGDRATYGAFMKHMAPFSNRLTVIQDDSSTAIASLAGVDAIFIDAGHDYPEVRKDIAAARLVVKPGGIISGHDYAGDNGVCQAVHEAFGGRHQLGDFDVELPGAKPGKGRCWWVVAP